MLKMSTGDGRTGLPEINNINNNHDRSHSDTEAPLTNKRGNKKRATFNIPDGGPEIISHSVKSKPDGVKTAGGADVEDPEVSVLGKVLERRPSVVGNASSRIHWVSEELKRLKTFSKRKPVGQLSRTKSVATSALKGLMFISKDDRLAGWSALEKRFDELTKGTTDGLLPRSLFWKCIDMREGSEEFAGELFSSLARRRNITGDSINKEELWEFWDQISDQSFDSRLHTFIDMVDKDADGKITEDEVRQIIILSASTNKLSNIKKQADKYAALIMEELDPDNLGYIIIEHLEMLLTQAQTHDEEEESHNLSQELKTKQNGNLIWRWYGDFSYFLLDNWQRLWVIALWIGVMMGLFTWKYIQYKDRAVYKVLGHCVCIAKASAETLKLNMAIILLPVCRNTITFLRNKTRLGGVVPFEDNFNFHKVIAVGISIGVGLHAISHLTCDFPRLIHATEEEYKPMQQFFGDQAKNYWHFVKEVEGYTGIIMVVLMTIAFTLATPWLRRNKFKDFLHSYLLKITGFNAFWYSHHLFIIVYTLLIVHGIKLYLTKEWYKKTTWMYLAVPILLYACERLIRAFRSSVQAVDVLWVPNHRGNVLALHMSKPKGFKYKSGQYMFVKCDAISPFEWHPFSITSAPDDNYLSVHIRSLGDWTAKIKEEFFPLPNQKNGSRKADSHGENRNYPKVSIDGPYGAPAQDYKKYDIVLLVGLGIGATPMISIVKDIVNNIKAKEEEENNLENGVYDTDVTLRKNNKFKTTKAYFYWVTREDTFDWFKGVMDDAASMDKNHVIEMHNYCTTVYEEGDARSALITMLQSLNLAKNGVDVVSNCRVKTYFAKPNWYEMYKHVANKHIGSRIGVFYCGATGPIKDLKQLAHDFSHKTSTKFDFHKEIF